MRRVPAIIETGAVVSVCSPKLVRELNLSVTPWRSNRLVSVYGKEITPGGAAWISISDGESKLEGEALVLEGDIDLLLRKDLLGKLGTRMKIGALPEILIGETSNVSPSKVGCYAVQAEANWEIGYRDRWSYNISQNNQKI